MSLLNTKTIQTGRGIQKCYLYISIDGISMNIEQTPVATRNIGYSCCFLSLFSLKFDFLSVNECSLKSNVKQCYVRESKKQAVIDSIHCKTKRCETSSYGCLKIDGYSLDFPKEKNPITKACRKAVGQTIAKYQSISMLRYIR